MPKVFDTTDPTEINSSRIKQAFARVPIVCSLGELIEGYGLADVLWAFADHARAKAIDFEGEDGLEEDQRLWEHASKVLMRLTDKAIEVGL